MEESTTTAATETQPVTFHSSSSNYRVIVSPARRRQIGESNESEIVAGKSIQFYDGVYVTDDPEEIDWLRNYVSHGRLYWEVGSDADRPADSAGILAEIIRLGFDHDQDGLADILVAERTSTSRPEVIAACEAALNQLGGDLPPRPDTPLHELQRVRMGPAAGTTPGVSPDPVPGTPEVDPSTLEAAPGQPAAPSEEPAVPVGQVPAQAPPSTDAPSDTAEVPSATMPNAQGPLATSDPAVQGDATVTSDAAPVGEQVPTDTAGDHPAADGDGGEPGAPAAGPDGWTETPPQDPTQP